VQGEPVEAGGVALMGLTAIKASDVPDDAEQAVRPEPLQGGITGVVWRDFKPGGGVPGEVESDELGLPGVTVELRDDTGSVVAKAKSEADGTFAFDDVEAGAYRAAISASTFATPFAGVSWLGSKLIVPAIMIAYIWVWAGFAMVVIAAGMAAIPRDLLEAARTDGANEWQLFRRVTILLLRPSSPLSYHDAHLRAQGLRHRDRRRPGSVQDDANVIALACGARRSAARDFGLWSAIAVFLFLLVIPCSR
jgi:alpha-glucoside transport system permease protein